MARTIICFSATFHIILKFIQCDREENRFLGSGCFSKKKINNFFNKSINKLKFSEVLLNKYKIYFF